MIHAAAIAAEPGHPLHPADQRRSAARTGALLLAGQFIAMWTAFFILAPAINWPASLGEPPAVILPLIRAHASAVFLGYLSYIIHALLLIPAAAILPVALGMGPQQRTSLLFGGLAGFAKALGISRWLFVMPGLATAFTAPGASIATRSAISVVYQAFNAYAGGIGEILGVGLFAGIWTLLLSAALLKMGARMLGIFGMAAGLLLLATLLSVVGIESPVLLTGSGIVWQLWTLALAVKLWRSRLS
ncbi:DUF4386 family protein [Sphingobium algorifonticola]|nr:DUF4386 family protein [Sphingobium algorifonticola]